MGDYIPECKLSHTIKFSNTDKEFSARRSTWLLKPALWALCKWHPPITGGFPSQRTSNTKFYIPASTKLKGGYTGFILSVCPSYCLSVCGQNRVRSVSSTILVGSISYLHILSSNLRRCAACNVCSIIKRLKIFGKFFKFVTLTLSSSYFGSNLIQNFDIVFFLLGIQFDSIVRVTMRRLGVSWERRRSSCSSYITMWWISTYTYKWLST